MAEYVLNRNYVLRTTMGHSVSFEKGVPTFVPKLVEREAVLIGAECVGSKNPDVLDPEEVVVPPLSPDERQEQLVAAFELIRERNDSKDFTGASVPTVAAVRRVVDFDADRNEITAAWAEYRQR